MTVFNAVDGRSVNLTPIPLDEVPPNWRPFLNTSRPDVKRAWGARNLYDHAGGPPTPGGVLAQLRAGNFTVVNGALLATGTAAPAAPVGRSRVEIPEGAPPAPSAEEALDMQKRRLNLADRPNWAWVVENRDKLSAAACGILLGCSIQAVYESMAAGRLPRRAGGEQ